MLRHTDALDFLGDGGELGGLMRAHDWSGSPLGAPDTWAQPLRTVVSLMLGSQFRMFVAWGDELGFLYNEAYAELLGAKHPATLGVRFQDIWSEIWSDISPLINIAMAGQATFSEDLPLIVNRRGFEEQAWFTFSYSPVRDEGGLVAGMSCAVAETTGRVLAERAVRSERPSRKSLVRACFREGNLVADASFLTQRHRPSLEPQPRLDGQARSEVSSVSDSCQPPLARSLPYTARLSIARHVLS